MKTIMTLLVLMAAIAAGPEHRTILSLVTFWTAFVLLVLVIPGCLHYDLQRSLPEKLHPGALALWIILFCAEIGVWSFVLACDDIFGGVLACQALLVIGVFVDHNDTQQKCGTLFT